MPSTILTNVTGIDGQVPVYNPSGLWQWWAYTEIWLGQAGLHKYVPKVNDYVMDYDTYTTFKVVALDPTTLIPTLQQVHPMNMILNVDPTDVLFGVGPGTQADTYRIYLDKSVLPHVLSVDSRLKVAGSMCSYAKIFKGAVLDSDANVISQVYDNSGNFLSENVPLELVAIDSHVNYSIKVVATCHTVADLVDGEIVTVVCYSDQGRVVSKRQLLVENTSFIRSVNASAKYITNIALESVFLSPTDTHRIDFPLNIPVNALNMIGVVNYSDGSVLKLPVDGNKFRMFGIETYTSTIIGQSIPLVLSYALAPNEITYNAVSGDFKYITEKYELVTTNPNNSYAVKLFCYPVFLDEVRGYTLEWFLLNLDRNLYFDVSQYVVFNASTGPFDPTAYGYIQRKSVSVDLSLVSASYKPFIHTQNVEITLNYGDQTNTTYPWSVAHESLEGKHKFGIDLMAKIIDSTTINLSSEFATLEDWLISAYTYTYPLSDRTKELKPPTPTHMVISYGPTNVELRINLWNTDIDLLQYVIPNSSVFIRFIKRTSTGDLQLSIASMMIKQ